MSIIPEKNLEKRISDLIYGMNKVEALLAYQEASGASLKRSKEFVDDLENKLRAKNPEKFYDYSKNINDEFLNFYIESIYLHFGGQIFDLHNHFKLQGYTYKTQKRIFELAFYGDIRYCSQNADNKVKADLKFIFRNVSFLRIQDESLDETNVCFEKIRRVGSMNPKPEIALQVEQEMIERNAVSPDGKYNEESTSGIDWNKYFYLNFVWGVDILIAAETVEASLHQTVEIDR